MSEIYVCHTGTDTWFSLSDTAFMIDSKTAGENDEDESMANGYLASLCQENGYEITRELAQKIYELVRSYHES